MVQSITVEYTQETKFKKFLQTPPIMMLGKVPRLSQEAYSSSFFPDYDHDVDRPESEGLGSSGRVETELTASEDSCAPRRKCISLNVDSCDGFNVPLQVLSLSKMSRSERKELELKLRSELEQVLITQKKIQSRCVDGIAVSASSDVRSYVNGQRRAAPENLHKSLKKSSGQGGKKRPPVGGRYGKRDPSGRFESMTQTTNCTDDAMLMKQCEMLLKRLLSHKFGWVFKEPVDVVKLKIPDYFTIIKQPMDLGTIKTKMASGAYTSPLEFAADVRLTFSNSMTYNPPTNDVHIMADTLNKFFETRWKLIEKKLAVSDSPAGPAKSTVSREIEASQPPIQSKKRKQPSLINHKVKSGKIERTMTIEEKQILTRDLESLEGDMLEKVVDFLRGCCNANQTNEAEVEVDIDALSGDALFTLRKLLDDHFLEKQRNQVKGEACEIELLNESGLSNSSMQPCKVNEAADEDVDIGGSDPPVSSYPPVEIEKDTAPRTSKCSSRRSSSSESSSSSSDSDSGTSSGSESGGANISSAKHFKDSVASDAAMDQERSDVLDPLNGNRSVNELEQTENSSQSKLVSTEVDGLQEGENAPSERQVSPEKLYRAALLRSRFADTILKAREKALEKGEKGDPEKLRQEREELERQQREEKARLQAEAKAAEDARKRAEAEAAAEAKRKRELEREAARLALQKMEKTVEINGNCHFLNDLEMLGSAPTEHLLSSVDETSPDQSDGMCGFKLTGSNPLEQLGLYMKVDDEEEEEGDHENAPLNDVEEGEID